MLVVVWPCSACLHLVHCRFGHTFSWLCCLSSQVQTPGHGTQFLYKLSLNSLSGFVPPNSSPCSSPYGLLIFPLTMLCPSTLPFMCTFLWWLPWCHCLSSFPVFSSHVVLSPFTACVPLPWNYVEVQLFFLPFRLTYSRCCASFFILCILRVWPLSILPSEWTDLTLLVCELKI